MSPTLATAARDLVLVLRDISYEASAEDERQGIYAALANQALTSLAAIVKLEQGMLDLSQLDSWKLDLASWTRRPK